jgi:hypothetical protein
MTAIESRILSGAADNTDVQWLEFLGGIFRGVSVSGLVNHGMPASDARRLVNVLALADRTINPDVTN